MCHGHPHFHTCSHTSVKWLYCPEAIFDLDTGYETPCSNPIYSTPQSSNSDCPLQNCHFKSMRGCWTCCQCGHNSNTQGWCMGSKPADTTRWTPMGLQADDLMTCGHGACNKCNRTPSSMGTTPEAQYELRKVKSSRKTGSRTAHKRPKCDYSNVFPTIHEEERSSSSGSSSGSSLGSRGTAFDVNLDYSSKKSKAAGARKKGQRRSHY